MPGNYSAIWVKVSGWPYKSKKGREHFGPGTVPPGGRSLRWLVPRPSFLVPRSVGSFGCVSLGSGGLIRGRVLVSCCVKCKKGEVHKYEGGRGRVSSRGHKYQGELKDNYLMHHRQAQIFGKLIKLSYSWPIPSSGKHICGHHQPVIPTLRRTLRPTVEETHTPGATRRRPRPGYCR